MPDRPHNVLFLCTGNSARSIIGEAILNKLGAGNFHAYSAGSQPKGRVNLYTLQLLQNLGYDISGFRSKSWDAFAKPASRNSISSSLSVTTRRPSRVRYGRANR